MYNKIHYFKYDLTKIEKQKTTKASCARYRKKYKTLGQNGAKEKEKEKMLFSLTNNCISRTPKLPQLFIMLA